MKVTWLPMALRDMRNISTWLEHQPEQENKVRRSIIKTIDLLTKFPKMGRQSSLDGYFKIGSEDYLVYYRPTNDTLMIYAVVHQNREQRSAIGTE